MNGANNADESTNMPALNTMPSSVESASQQCNNQPNGLDASTNHTSHVNSVKDDDAAEPAINVARNRGNSVRSSSDGAVEAMEGSSDDKNILYRTVSESDKHERARQNEILMKEGAMDSETETEGPDSPEQCGAILQLNGHDALSTPDGLVFEFG